MLSERGSLLAISIFWKSLKGRQRDRLSGICPILPSPPLRIYFYPYLSTSGRVFEPSGLRAVAHFFGHDAVLAVDGLYQEKATESRNGVGIAGPRRE
jgi:hypothetical protein